MLHLDQVEDGQSVDIYNMQGVLVDRKTTQLHQIDVTRLPQGMYIVELKPQRTSERYKLIKVD
ncbi:MAG: T9SS type A sorting domain-containing protein [Saprospiraceae bacterium]|nr:T9SS type A sorting domain-containing protein [Saprospiraceae bacterium]